MAQQQWKSTFSADPDQVRKHDEVTLTVTARTPVSTCLARRKCNSLCGWFRVPLQHGNLLLQNAINQASGNDTRQFSFEVPDLASGDYNIAVKSKPRLEEIG